MIGPIASMKGGDIRTRSEKKGKKMKKRDALLKRGEDKTRGHESSTMEGGEQGTGEK